MEKHLEMIQATISRLASNSYSYKGWALTVTAALVTFLFDKPHEKAIYTIYPALAFWALDAFNLSLERSFRKLYERVRLGEVEEFDMNISNFRRPFFDQMTAMMTVNMMVFYGTMVAFVIVVLRP